MYIGTEADFASFICSERIFFQPPGNFFEINSQTDNAFSVISSVDISVEPIYEI